MFIEFQNLERLLQLIPKNDRSEARAKCRKYGGFNAFQYKIETRWVWQSKERTAEAEQHWLLATNEMPIYKAFQNINALLEKVIN